MLIDNEAVVQDLKAVLQEKDSWGRRELLTKIGELEAKYRISEGTIERALRVTGNRISDELLHYPKGQSPSSPAVVGAGANGN